MSALGGDGMIKNLLHWYNLATDSDLEASRWYNEAHDACLELSKREGVDYKQVVYAVAALSPMLSWDYNILAVEQLITHGETNYGLKKNRIKAVRILEGDLSALSGQKVMRFAKSILNPRKYTADVVTVDVHACRAWDNRLTGDRSLSANEYAKISDGYKQAAAIVGLAPGEFQAVVWVVIRRISKRHGQLGLGI